jgi:hypothetical protein
MYDDRGPQDDGAAEQRGGDRLGDGGDGDRLQPSITQ